MDRFQVVESFVRVAQVGSFTKAAMQLGLSRALISRRIADLEGRLGVRLLNRSTRSVSLTVEGKTYLARCKRVLDDLETAEREIGRGGTTPFGTIRIRRAEIVRRSMAVGGYDRFFKSASADPHFALAK